MSRLIRKIGGTPVQAIGFGAMGLSVGYGQTGSTEERLKVHRGFFSGSSHRSH